MPLDWAEVKKRYQGGSRIPTVGPMTLARARLAIQGGSDDHDHATGTGRDDQHR
jgi:alpha-D-ribose 1-methylphosphonate 5-triphosphate synthase subunit PhnG